MPFLGRSLLAIGGLFLSHACYSAHESTHVLSPNTVATALGSSAGIGSASVRLPSLTAPTPTFAISNLPPDIIAEVLISLFLLTLGIVFSSEPLKPVRWSEWAAQVEHGSHGPESRYVRSEGDIADMSPEQLGQKLYGGPTQEGFRYLENGRRMGFFDIRAKRKEFAEWVKKGAAKDTIKQ